MSGASPQNAASALLPSVARERGDDLKKHPRDVSLAVSFEACLEYRPCASRDPNTGRRPKSIGASVNA
jgi:hypothetical protein